MLAPAAENDYPPRMRFSLVAILVAFTAISVIGCSEDDPPPAKVFISAQLGPGTEADVNGAAQCKLTTQPWLNLGKTEASVETGTKQSESSIEVECSVVPAGDGYSVIARASLLPGGTVTISGTFKSSGAQSGITASFTRADTGTPFRDKNCTVEYASKDMGVGPGMVWGRLTCPHAEQSGSGEKRMCQGTAEFKFENCGK